MLSTSMTIALTIVVIVIGAKIFFEIRGYKQ